MNKEQYITIRDLSFTTKGYHKNFDLMVTGESIINEYDGKISKLQILQKKLPLQLGEYSLSTWNLRLGREINVNTFDLLKIHTDELTYNEFYDLIKNNHISFDDYDKIVFIHSLVLIKDYRKKLIIEEFIEFIHGEFYSEKVLIVALVLPIQYNKQYFDYHTNTNLVEEIYGRKYYGLDELISKNSDRELNEFKLFSVAQKCGFERIDESYLFKYNPTKTIERLKVKWSVGKKL